MKLIRFALLAAAFAVMVPTPGCSSADCVSICQEAQDKNCTSIKGDCVKGCAALEEVAKLGNCGSQRDAYQSCAEKDEVCTIAARCGGEQTSFSTCVGVYCAANQNNADCVTAYATF